MSPFASKIPVSVIVVTKNEASRIERCLKALAGFSEVLVVDSASTDKTKALAEIAGARVINFEWSGAYPKKRQWCLDTLDLAHDWVFFVDADEIITSRLADDIRALHLDLPHNTAGYFVKGQYIFEGRRMKFGLKNNKLALFNRHKLEFPVINDLDIPSMGEIEGHYQPVLKTEFKKEAIGQLHTPLIHDAYDDPKSWKARHTRYAKWESEMDKHQAWPEDVNAKRDTLKRLFKALPLRGEVAFLHSYIISLGFLDGAEGLRFALSRKQYYDMIKKLFSV